MDWLRNAPALGDAVRALAWWLRGAAAARCCPGLSRGCLSSELALQPAALTSPAPPFHLFPHQMSVCRGIPGTVSELRRCFGF